MTARQYLKEGGEKAGKPSLHNMKKCGFSRKERLTSPFQYKAVYKQKRAAKGTLFWLYRMPNGLRFNRLGISVSNRLCSNLVQRNKIKKIIRQIFQHNKLSFGSFVDAVIVLKKRPSDISFKVFEKEILGLIKK